MDENVIYIDLNIEFNINVEIDWQIYGTVPTEIYFKPRTEITIYTDHYIKVGNILIIRDRETLDEITRIDNVIEPLITEEINSNYDFTFNTFLDENTKHLVYPNIIEVDNDYFRITTVEKTRDKSISISVGAEHISYELNEVEDNTENYDGVAYDIARYMLKDTPFEIGIIESAWRKYVFFSPSDTNIRKRLFDLSDLVNGEIEFDKFTIHLRNQRGFDKGVDFVLGENIIGVTESTEVENGVKRTAYEINVLDLAQDPEYTHLKTVNLGDNVGVYDNELGIEERQRVIKRQYNPFQKINPKISIGNTIRDITTPSHTERGTGLREIINLEFGKGEVKGEITEFLFEKEYDEVRSINYGLVGDISNHVTITGELIKNKHGRYVGVFVKTIGTVPLGKTLTVQAVCYRRG